MILRPALLIGVLSVSFVLGGCGGEGVDGPPSVRLGDSVCTECGMIISDERFATATVIESDRGREALLFDDFSCQKNFESKHSDSSVVDRWSHDHGTSAWFHTSQAWFVRSAELRTPMASQAAAFVSEEDARVFAETINGQILSFEKYWSSK